MNKIQDQDNHPVPQDAACIADYECEEEQPNMEFNELFDRIIKDLLELGKILEDL
jgi:hypothetical protein